MALPKIFTPKTIRGGAEVWGGLSSASAEVNPHQTKLCQMHSKTGFTLIEIIVVMGLLVIVGSLGLYMSLDTFRGSSFRNDRDSIVSALRRARSQAISNICIGNNCIDGQSHGVHLETGRYIIFQGASYNWDDPLNETIQANANNAVITSSGDALFGQLSGRANPAVTISVIGSDGRKSDITINEEGRVDWSN